MSVIRKELEKAIKIKQNKGEDYQEYLERLADESDDLSDKKFDGLSKEAQDWLNKAVSALEKNKAVADFPDSESDEEEEEKPAKKGKSKGKKSKKSEPEEEEDPEEEEEEDPEEEEEEDPEEEEEEDPEEEEEEKPAKKGKSKGKGKSSSKGKKSKKSEPEEDPEEEEEEEEKPAKKGKSKGKGKAEKKPKKEKKDKKPSAISRIQYYTCKHPKWDKEKIGEKVAKEGYTISPSTLGIQYGQAHAIMKILEEING